jgi:hypothetical protein
LYFFVFFKPRQIQKKNWSKNKHKIDRQRKEKGTFKNKIKIKSETSSTCQHRFIVQHSPDGELLLLHPTTFEIHPPPLLVTGI